MKNHKEGDQISGNQELGVTGESGEIEKNPIHTKKNELGLLYQALSDK